MKNLLLLVVSLSSCISATGQTEPPRPHILGISQVNILATNHAVSVDFYSKTLSLTQDPDQIFSLNPLQDIWLLSAPTPTPANLIGGRNLRTARITCLPPYHFFHKIEQIFPPLASAPNDANYFTRFVLKQPNLVIFKTT